MTPSRIFPEKEHEIPNCDCTFQGFLLYSCHDYLLMPTKWYG